MLLILIGLLGEALSTITVAMAAGCEMASPHAQPTDANYRLKISGNPDLFLPDENYIVTLQGMNTGSGQIHFTGFEFWVEPVVATDKTESYDSNVPLGTLKPKDKLSKPHERCQSALTNATSQAKTDVQVIWASPVQPQNSCVRLCARVYAAESKFSSELARKICAASEQPANFYKTPNILDRCCACDEAKYEVIFVSTWSKHIHPHALPPEAARKDSQFGEIIGASHAGRFRFWQEGRTATLGLRKLAETGSTTAIEKELKAKSDYIRTIIKTKGISWEQVDRNDSVSTAAVFHVDAINHLVSLVSKLSPSPDWIVGVSALELCNLNCKWTRSITIPLYPYDVGTDEGITYLSRRLPTIPPAPIRALGPNWPNNTESPFYSTTNEMRPFAKLIVNRLLLLKKKCSSSDSRDSTPAIPWSGHIAPGDEDSACATSAWSQWEPCSVTCGRGTTVRQRYYLWPRRAKAAQCRVPLSEHTTCDGPRLHCNAVSDYEPDAADMTGPCAVSPWSEWSPCEGCGIRVRTRRYLNLKRTKLCHVNSRGRTPFSQTMLCDKGPCYKPAIYRKWTNNDWFYSDMPSWPCRMSAWSEWTSCSAHCGRGRRIRTRHYMHADSAVLEALTRRLKQKWVARFCELRNLEIPVDNLTAANSEVEAMVQSHLKICGDTPSMQEAICDGDSKECNQNNSSKDICELPLDVGFCRTYSERWFYDVDRQSCEPFSFTGCGGNANNFASQEECADFCVNITTP